MRRNGHKATSGVQFDFKCDFSVPDFLYVEKFWKLDHDFMYFLANFLLCMHRNGQNFTSGQIFNSKFEIPMGCFLFEYKFWWRICRDLCVFWAKNGFCNAKFSEFGVSGGEGDYFLTKPPKGTSLADFTHFEPLCVQIHSHFFSLGDYTEKTDTTKSHREVSPICG